MAIIRSKNKYPINELRKHDKRNNFADGQNKLKKFHVDKKISTVRYA